MFITAFIVTQDLKSQYTSYRFPYFYRDLTTLNYTIASLNFLID